MGSMRRTGPGVAIDIAFNAPLLYSELYLFLGLVVGPSREPE